MNFSDLSIKNLPPLREIMNLSKINKKALIYALTLSLLNIEAQEIQATENKASKTQEIFMNFPPIGSEGQALFSYKNDSGLNDDNIFIQVVGINKKTALQCFITYDNQGNPNYFDVTEDVDSRNYAFPLSYFPLSTEENEHLIYLPQIEGGRIYTSINQKIVFLVVKNNEGVWTICAPNPLNPTDPNRNTLWDKTEYTVDSLSVFINPTAVDDFSLPLYCQETGVDGSTQSGGLSIDRNLIFTTLENAFNEAGGPWNKLLSITPSLVYSPMYASATGVFPQDLFVTTGWIEAFVSFFSLNPIQIDAAESLPINLGGGVWKGTIDKTSLEITFQRDVDETHPPIPEVFLTLPTKTAELIAGSGPSWKIAPGNFLQPVFARNIACAIDTNTLTTKDPLSQKYFINKSSCFYQHNDEMPENLQFIDYYSKVLHSFGNHQIYTLPYDDELGQSGSASYSLKNFSKGLIKLSSLQ